MSSSLTRLGLLAVTGTVLAGAIALAQDGKPTGAVSARGVAVFNPVEGRIVVASARPDGSRVEKGDIVCELDPADLRDRLTSQEIVVSGAQREVNGTRIAHEVTLITLLEFKEGGYTQLLATAMGQIKLAESKLSRAADQVDWSERMYAKGYGSLAEKNTDQLALQQARFALEEAQSQKKVLVDYSKERTIKALTGEIESAKARELAARAVLVREQSLQKKLADEIGRCKVKAPIAGRIEYTAPLGAGAVMHDGQLIFRVVTDGAERVKSE